MCAMGCCCRGCGGVVVVEMDYEKEKTKPLGRVSSCRFSFPFCLFALFLHTRRPQPFFERRGRHEEVPGHLAPTPHTVEGIVQKHSDFVFGAQRG